MTDAILARSEPREALGQILQFVRFLAGDDDIAIDPAVAKSETASGWRNAALANFMRDFGTIQRHPDKVLGTYFHQCAIAMTARQLAHAGGSWPLTAASAPAGRAPSRRAWPARSTP